MLRLLFLILLFAAKISNIHAQSDYKNKINKLKRQYEWVFTGYEGEIIPVKKDRKVGFVRMSNLSEMIPCVLDVHDAKPFSEGMASVNHLDKGEGFIDTTGKLVIPYQFRYTSIFKEDVCYVQASDRKNYFIDKKGNKLFEIESGFYETFNEGVYPVSIDKGNYVKEYRFLDKKGQPINPYVYKRATHFESGLACVSKDEVNYGYINPQGKSVIPEIYSGCSPYDYKRPLLLEKKNSRKYFFFDTDGTLLNQDTTIENVFHLKNDYFGVKKANGKFGIIDKNQKYILEPTLDFLYKTAYYYYIENGVFNFLHQKISDAPLNWKLNSIQELMILEKRDKNRNLYTFIDKNGKLSKNVFLSIQKYFTKGLFVAQDTFNKMGLIQSDNTTVLPFEYDKIISNREIEPEHYIIKKGKKQGVANTDGKIVIPPIYDTLFYNYTYLKPGYDAFLAKKDSLWGVIDVYGYIIIPIDFEFLSSSLKGLAQKNGKLGLIDDKGNTVTPFEHDNIDVSEISNWINLEKDGRYGLASAADLKLVVPAIYDYCEVQSEDIRGAIIGHLEGKKQVISYSGKKITELLDNITPLPLSGRYYTGYMLEKDKKFGILDNEFNTILPLEFDKIKNIKNKYYIATKNNKEYFYQKDGKSLYQNEVDKIMNSDEESLLIVKSKDKVGLLEIVELVGLGEDQIYEIIDATLRLQYEYDDIEKIKEAPFFYKVTKDKKIGIYSKYGKRLVIPAEYDKIENIDSTGKTLLKKNGAIETYLLLGNGNVNRQN